MTTQRAPARAGASLSRHDLSAHIWPANLPQTAALLALLALAVFVFAPPSNAADLPPLGANITARQAHPLVKTGRISLIDIRLESEWRVTGIAEGAIPVTMHQPMSRFLAELAAHGITPDSERPIALICARGVRSHRLQAALERVGFKHVIDVGDGTLGSRHGPGWRPSGLPMSVFRR